jgi:pyruvate formate lyase activating enzyme
MAKCQFCGAGSATISSVLSCCAACLRTKDETRDAAARAHSLSRAAFGFAASPPRSEAGVECELCHNECVLAPGERGFCVVRKNEGGNLAGPTADLAYVSWYYDPLPTNCVASWVCPAETGAGYPQFTHSLGPEYGYKNLAVFYHACSFDCLFCQNWHYRLEAKSGAIRTAQELAQAVDSRTSCICHFGGDPTPQLPHALRASRLALEANRGRILRICWETNGCMNPALLDEMVELSLASGGCVKFDLKAWNENIHLALTGASNRRTLDNFRRAAEGFSERADPPLLVASTLLVPGYVDEEEVSALARFIASLSPEIPYSLLGFHPDFYMHDLPTTCRAHAERCLEAAQVAGVKNVRIGNLHVLGPDY